MEHMKDLDSNDSSLPEYISLEIRDEAEEQDDLQFLQLSTTSRPVIVIYPTIAPETVVIPIVVSIIVFPIFVVSAIFLLRYYNQRARAKDKFRSGMQSGAAAIFSLSKISATNKPTANRRHQYQDRFLCMPELGLDTLIEEKELSVGTSDDAAYQNTSGAPPPIRAQPNGIMTNIRSSKGDASNPSKKRVTYNEDHTFIQKEEETNSLPMKNITQIVINGASSKAILTPETPPPPLIQESAEEIQASHSFSKTPISVTKVKDLGPV